MSNRNSHEKQPTDQLLINSATYGFTRSRHSHKSTIAGKLKTTFSITDAWHWFPVCSLQPLTIIPVEKADAGKTKREKGTRLMLLIDGNRLPSLNTVFFHTQEGVPFNHSVTQSVRLSSNTSGDATVKRDTVYPRSLEIRVKCLISATARIFRELTMCLKRAGC
ncbi:hypothetical protein Pan161_04510 [Gimesia algae]|uniref:Uncharacterized protein n=1 Tax=Gimesia algae TaxID=2527971 RepID=A0A517V754_9PLAN|nr:hypothetical protein Pan161_04510 [Gimesia algae]